jgi:hypothetical protein
MVAVIVIRRAILVQTGTMPPKREMTSETTIL